MSIRFLVFSDLHFEEMADGPRRVEELAAALEREAPDFCVCLGDLCEPEPANAFIRERLEGCGVPVYYALGNHDTDTHSPEEALRFLGLERPWYSFDRGEYRFIVLNACYCEKDGEVLPYHRRNYKGEGSVYPLIPDEELAWLEGELAGGKRTVILSHQSLVNDFPRRGVCNRAEVRALLEEAGAVLCMNGHDHGSAFEMRNGVAYYAVNAASYMWAGSLIAASAELREKYGRLHGILPYADALRVLVELDGEEIRIKGMQSGYQSVTPRDLGMTVPIWNGVSVLPETSSHVIPMRRKDE